jgi:hypothetical protein
MTIGGKLGDLKARAETAIQAFERALLGLSRPDGSKVYADEEHERRLSALRAERNRVLSEVEQGAREEAEAALAEISRLEHRDPQELLSPDELERANLRRAFALDTAETLATTELVARLEAVLAGGDKGSIFSYWMAGQRRRRSILEGMAENAASGTDDPRVRAAQATGGTPLDDVLAKMFEVLDGGRTAAAIEAAREHIGHAHEVGQLAYLALREQSSVYAPTYSVPGR